MTSFDPEKITFFAKTDARGKNVAFGIKAKDRQRHMYVVGKTGMGKSTLLENMAVQDIQNGEGMAFIDPHGSAAETLLEYVPEHRVNDVVYFAPFDLDNPISFNVMEDVGQDKRHLVVSGLMSTFKKIWVDAWSARMEYILTNALLVLIEYPDTTLLSVNRIFNDKAFRLKVVDYCTDAAVKSFWVDEFANYTERFAAEALPAIQNKIGQFTGNPLIRNIIGQPHSSFDFREMMDKKKIVIMNLSKGLIGETNANLLGSMLTTRIYLAAMSRADLPVAEMKKMPNFYFYVDEFQSFANATFANILSEARKYHLNLIIAHQYIEQMEEEVRDAVFGNVGTTISFRVGPFDAETLETVFTPRFLAADLVNLGFAQIYLTLMIDGIGSQPFSAVTLPPIALPQVSCRNMVIAASRKNYTHPREEVEKIVFDLHTPAKEEKKPSVVKPAVKVNGVVSVVDEKKTAPWTKSSTTSSHSVLPRTTVTTASVPPAISVPVPVSVPALVPALAPVVEVALPTLMSSESVLPVPAPMSQAEQSLRESRPLTQVAHSSSRNRDRNNRGEHSRSNESTPRTTAQPIMGATINSRTTTKSSSVRSADTRSLGRPAPKAVASVDDLKSILARIAKAPAVSDTAKPAYSHSTKTAAAPNAEAASPLKAALSALEKVDTSAPRTLPPRPVPVSELPPLSHVDRITAEYMAAETEAAFAALETKHTNAIPPQQPPETGTASPFTPHSVTNKAEKHQEVDTASGKVNPKTVAKLLKHSANERSPFR